VEIGIPWEAIAAPGSLPCFPEAPLDVVEAIVESTEKAAAALIQYLPDEIHFLHW
jgi:hypothetical protein